LPAKASEKKNNNNSKIGNIHYYKHILIIIDLANPTALLLSSIMMLRHMHLGSYADTIENAVLKTIAEGKNLTRDLGGKATNTEFTNQVIDNFNR
jgi:isocitrate/isopropylmalate dehydrogenase